MTGNVLANNFTAAFSQMTPHDRPYFDRGIVMSLAFLSKYQLIHNLRSQNQVHKEIIRKIAM